MLELKAAPDVLEIRKSLWAVASEVPLAIYGLELMLNTVQALIFSVLTLMFTLAAIEGHHGDEAHGDQAIADPIGPDELDEIFAPAH